MARPKTPNPFGNINLVLLDGRFHIPEELTFEQVRKPDITRTYGQGQTNALAHTAENLDQRITLVTRKDPMLEGGGDVPGWTDLRLYNDERKLIVEDPVVMELEKSMRLGTWEVRMLGEGAVAKEYV